MKLHEVLRSYTKMSPKIERIRKENWSKNGSPGLCILESDTRQIEVCHPSFEPKRLRKYTKASLQSLVTDVAVASMSLWGR